MAPLRGWGPKGERLRGFAPHGHWRTLTFLGALRCDRLTAPCVFDGPINGECFRAYVEQQLVPVLKPGDIVIMDNLGSHKSAALRRMIRAAGARLWYLPPYSPDLNPIEQAFAKIKHWMRAAQKRSIEDTWRHIGQTRRHHPARRMRQLLRQRRIRFRQNMKRSRACWDSSGVYHGGGEMDHGCEALIGFVGAHGDAFELLELARRSSRSDAAICTFPSSIARGFARRGCWEMTTFAPRCVEIGDNGVAVEGFVGDQRVEGQSPSISGATPTVSKRCPGRQDEADEIAERIGEGQDFGGHAAFGAADGLALGPPFAPCPWRWTLTMVASTMAYSMSGSSETASKSRLKTSAFAQSRKRVKTLFQWPNDGGRSRQGLPVRAIHSTASTNRRLSLPLRPGPACPDKAAPSSPIGRPSEQIGPSTA